MHKGCDGSNLHRGLFQYIPDFSKARRPTIEQRIPESTGRTARPRLKDGDETRSSASVSLGQVERQEPQGQRHTNKNSIMSCW